MYCYQCGCLLTENDFCTNCGADVKRYKKIVAVSNLHYNIGLERASVRDLSGAAESLRQCLKLNKNHVEARNLLGLVYYESGEVVSALNEWVLSKNVQPQKNIADDYMTAIGENLTQREVYAQSIRKYNQALHYCRQGSIDLAILQLKKVLSLNPKYLQAHLLLALIYITTEEWERASREVEKALRIDTGNTTALRYMKEIDAVLNVDEQPREARKKKKDNTVAVKKYKSGNDTVIQPYTAKESSGVSTIINIVIGVVIGLAIAMFLVLPNQVKKAKDKVNSEIQGYSEELSKIQADVRERDDEIKRLQSEIDLLNGDLENFTGTDGTLAAYDELLNAVSLYTSENYDALAVAESMGRIDNAFLETTASENFLAVYHYLLSAIGEEVSASYYQEGMTEYYAENYTDAIRYLEMAVYYNANDSMALFQLAEAYYRNNDLDNAEYYYEQVIELFPGYDSASTSQRRLGAIRGE